MLEPIDGPSKQFAINVNNTVPQELKVGTEALIERKVVTVQTNGKIWIYFGNLDIVPTQADLEDYGFEQFKSIKETYEAGPRQKVWVMAQSGTVEVRFAERS